MAAVVEIEARVQEAVAAGDFGAAALAGLDGYGHGLYRFVFAITRDPDLADDAYSLVCENMWTGLPGFRGQGSFHSWVYRIARHAGLRVLADPKRRRERNLSLSDAPEALAMAQRIRTETRPHLKSEVKRHVRHLREQLTTDEQMLLTLRVDRQMSWVEITDVLSDGDLAADERTAVTAKLRKRFERTKTRLRRLVENSPVDAAGG